MPTKPIFYLTTAAALLTSFYLWIFLLAASDNFIIPLYYDLNGQLYFLKSATLFEGVTHTPSPPYIHVSALDEDEFWNTSPTVRSPEGKCLPGMDFYTDEVPLGLLYQDVYYDSLRLTFTSCFGDMVEVTEKTLPQGKINLVTNRLDASVGYVRSTIPKDIDFSSIMVVLRYYGCFNFREERLSLLKLPDGSTMVNYVSPQNKATSKVVSTAETYNFFGEIIRSQKSRYEQDQINPIIALIKVDNYVTIIHGQDQDLSAIIELTNRYQEQ